LAVQEKNWVVRLPLRLLRVPIEPIESKLPGRAIGFQGFE
jgi:hypothetical protein